MDWRAIVASPLPSGADLEDPSSSAYDFSNLDASVESAVEAGLQPLLVVWGAPAFAGGPRSLALRLRRHVGPRPAGARLVRNRSDPPL